MSDFVLILLVNGREHFTKRWLEYMAKVEFKYKIAIGNGNKKTNIQLKKLIKKKNYSNLNIEYYSYDNKNYKDYYYMMYDVARRQKKAKFLKFCDNDDFILPHQLENLIKLSKKNIKCVSVGDRDMWFSLMSRSVYGNAIYFWPENFFRTNESFNISDIKKVFSNFQESFYNIFKKKYILKILKEIYQINFEDLEIRDFYLKLRLMSFGKTKFYNQVSYVRQHGTSQTSGNNFLYTKNFVKKNIAGDIKKLKDSFLKNVNHNNLFLKEIEDGYILYLNNVVGHNLRSINKKKIFKFKIFLNNKMPNLLCFLRKIQYFKVNYLLKKNYFNNYELFKKEINFLRNFLLKN